GASQIGAREADGSERGERVLVKVDVIEADDGEILRYVQTVHIRRAEDADGGHVIGADNGRGPRAELLQLREAGDAALEGVIAFDDPFLLHGQAGTLHGAAKLILASDGGVQMMGSGEKRDG